MDRQQELLPVPYFHVVFTLPHELNTLVLYNKEELYSCLLQSAWETIKTMGKDPKRLNGLMGALAILHTWSQTLLVHNHVHFIVPGGALVNGNEWNPSKSNYLFPIKAMSKIFRGIFISSLRSLYDQNQLTIPSDRVEDNKGEDNKDENKNKKDDGNNKNKKTDLSSRKSFDSLLNNLMKKPWVVYAKKPFAGPEQVLNYLGRYVNKIAISNNRILGCDEEYVTFKWRDYSDNNKIKIMKLKPGEFISRFLRHVVPKGFMRIRFFGFLANACKKKNIAKIKKLLSSEPNETGKQEQGQGQKQDQKQEQKQKKDIRTIMLELTGIDITLCPKCNKGHLHVIQEIPSKFGRIKFDTS